MMICGGRKSVAAKDEALVAEMTAIVFPSNGAAVPKRKW
jgi:hypothetical protein